MTPLTPNTKKLREKHGPEILKDFEALFKDPFWNLSEIGRKYGFTKENARRLFLRLYGFPYGKIKKEKDLRLKQELNIWDCLQDPRTCAAIYKPGVVRLGVEAEVLVQQKCEELGLKYKYRPKGYSIDFEINGKLVDVKSARVSIPSGRNRRTRYYHFSISKRQMTEVDFFICYIWPLKLFYVIPNEGRIIFIRATPNNHPNCRDNYKEYKEAWHLLS